jgi:hemin uptake protein HemP
MVSTNHAEESPMTQHPESHNDEDADDGPECDARKVVSAKELFEGEREICIEHCGERYRLRITRRNKLILQK